MTVCNEDDSCTRYDTVTEGFVEELVLLVALGPPVGYAKLTRTVFAMVLVRSFPGADVREVLSLAGIEDRVGVSLAESDAVVYLSLSEADEVLLLS